MRRYSNKVHFNSEGIVVAEEAVSQDPFTQLKPGMSRTAGYVNVLSNGYCACEQCDAEICYEPTENCELCIHRKYCEGTGCLNVMPKAFWGAFDLVFDMLELPYVPEYGSSRKTVPTLSPCPADNLHERIVHELKFNMLAIEFEVPVEQIVDIASKILSVPYIGNFALYPAYDPDEAQKTWVLLVPLDHCISYAQWTSLTDWLCNELGVMNQASLHNRPPCPTLAPSFTKQFGSLSENTAYAFPAHATLEMLLEQQSMEGCANLDTVDPVTYFNQHYCWQKLLTELGFYAVNDLDWCLPNSVTKQPAVRLDGENMHFIDADSFDCPPEPMSKFEVAMKWNGTSSKKWLFDLANNLPYGKTGLSVRDYNLSLVPSLFPKHGHSEDSNLIIKTGSDGWDEDFQWTLENHIQSNSLSMIYGPSGSFKSFHAIDWAACISTGTPWGGCNVKEGAVLYVAAEGDHGISRRIKAWETVHGKSVDKLVRIGKPVALTQPDGIAQLENAVKSVVHKYGDISLIVIDTVARCFGGGDENNTKDMGMFIAACDNLRTATNASVLLVHHTGKTMAREARGNSSLKAALDTEYRVTRNGSTTSLEYLLECTKQKDSEPVAPLVVKLSRLDLQESISSLCRTDEPRQKSTCKQKKCKEENDSQTACDSKTILSIIKTYGGKASREFLREEFYAELPGPVSATNSRARFSRAINSLTKKGLVHLSRDKTTLILGTK